MKNELRIAGNPLQGLIWPALPALLGGLLILLLADAAPSNQPPRPGSGTAVARVVVPGAAPGQVDLTATPTATSTAAPTATPTPAIVAAVVETTPVTHTGDAADDIAIWIHPSNPALSTILGTDKQGGLNVYDLSGNLLQHRPDGRMNNIDLRYNFRLGGRMVTLVTASERATRSIAIYQVNPATRLLEPVGIESTPGLRIYGLCMYRSPHTGRYYVFANSEDGQVEQRELVDLGGGQVGAPLVRSFAVSSQTEGCVADDELGHFYLGEESVGIWKYGAEPNASPAGTLIAESARSGPLVSDVEGLTIYYASDRTGYLIASSQGNNTYAIYQREGQNAYVRSFAIGEGNGIDEVSQTDGIDVTNFGLGSAFPQGLFIAQDGRNDTGNQNFKLVPWQAIAQAFSPPLTIDPAWDPRYGGIPPSPTPSPEASAPLNYWYLPVIARPAP